MRVATAHSYDTTIAQLNKRQAELAEQQERISTGKRVLRASDDPVAAALSEAVQNRLSRVEADKRTHRSLAHQIQQAESGAGRGGRADPESARPDDRRRQRHLQDTERLALAKEIEGLRDELFAVANRKDSAGRSLFGGLGGSTTPFVQEFGSAAARCASMASAASRPRRQRAAAGHGRLPDLHARAAGNGTFRIDLDTATPAACAATSARSPTCPRSPVTTTASTSPGRRRDAVQRHRRHHRRTGGRPHRRALQPGMQIEFDGMSFQLDGQPRAGDGLDITPPPRRPTCSGHAGRHRSAALPTNDAGDAARAPRTSAAP
jgi:flagellar hook-associated protein 3 FlgL